MGGSPMIGIPAKHPRSVVGVTWIQFLMGLFFAGIVGYLLLLTRSSEIRQGPDAASEISGLRIGAAALVPMALAFFVAGYGLSKGKLWGWWVALLVDLGMAAVFIYSLIDDHGQIDGGEVILAVIPLAALVWLVFPAVRGFYWKTRD